MRGLASATLGLWLGLMGGAQAESATSAVVVELFTSQGCSSCPPADEILGELVSRSDVIPLALHVDYWDYLGWADAFANPAFTTRQRAYAHVAGARSIYTPQMVVNGMEHLVGVRAMELADLIRQHRAEPSPVALTVTREGGQVRISAVAAYGLKNGAVIQLVRYSPSATVKIERGENQGRTITYANIVRSWEPLGRWNGQDVFETVADVPGEASTAVIVQEPGPGAILAAVALR